MEVDKVLYSEIKAYCDLNKIKTRDYIHNLLKKAFMEDKYGKMPAIFKKEELDKADKELNQIVQNIGEKEYNDAVTDLIMNSEEKDIKEEKQTTVQVSEPKIVKKIKRKL